MRTSPTIALVMRSPRLGVRTDSSIPDGGRKAARVPSAMGRTRGNGQEGVLRTGSPVTTTRSTIRAALARPPDDRISPLSRRALRRTPSSPMTRRIELRSRSALSRDGGIDSPQPGPDHARPRLAGCSWVMGMATKGTPWRRLSIVGVQPRVGDGEGGPFDEGMLGRERNDHGIGRNGGKRPREGSPQAEDELRVHAFESTPDVVENGTGPVLQGSQRCVDQRAIAQTIEGEVDGRKDGRIHERADVVALRRKGLPGKVESTGNLGEKSIGGTALAEVGHRPDGSTSAPSVDLSPDRTEHPLEDAAGELVAQTGPSRGAVGPGG